MEHLTRFPLSWLQTPPSLSGKVDPRMHAITLEHGGIAHQSEAVSPVQCAAYAPDPKKEERVRMN
jgi:hypothetical protein